MAQPILIEVCRQDAALLTTPTRGVYHIRPVWYDDFWARGRPVARLARRQGTLRPGQIYRIYTGLRLGQTGELAPSILFNIRPINDLWTKGFASIVRIDIDPLSFEIVVYIEVRADIEFQTNVASLELVTLSDVRRSDGKFIPPPHSPSAGASAVVKLAPPPAQGPAPTTTDEKRVTDWLSTPDAKPPVIIENTTPSGHAARPAPTRGDALVVDLRLPIGTDEL